MSDPADKLQRLADLIANARQAGASAADAVLAEGVSLTLGWRLGKLENLERAEGADVGLRVLFGRRQAIASSSDLSAHGARDLVERAVAMARAAPEDPFCGLADAADLARDFPDLDLADTSDPTVEDLQARARAAEDAARAVPGVTNSEGAQASFSRSTVALVASNGFAAARGETHHGVAASVLAGSGTAMETDYDYASATHAADLAKSETIGRSAGERAVRRLNPRKIETAKMPVVFEPRVASSLLRYFASAVNGASVARGTTFLKEKMGARIFPESVTIVDDPLRKRGLSSRPFDGEGLPARPLKLVEKGVLKSWVLDLRSARQLNLKSTGHAARGVSSPPSPSTSNLYLEPGRVSPTELIADIKDGLFVTTLIGMGVNGVTGDYSRGAAGFRIANGALAHPVSEVTIAGNLKDMFLALAAANDLEFRYGTDSPTVRIDGMTVAGR
jgi:PmbA protein